MENRNADTRGLRGWQGWRGERGYVGGQGPGGAVGGVGGVGGRGPRGPRGLRGTVGDDANMGKVAQLIAAAVNARIPIAAPGLQPVDGAPGKECRHEPRGQIRVDGRRRAAAPTCSGAARHTGCRRQAGCECRLGRHQGDGPEGGGRSTTHPTAAEAADGQADQAYAGVATTTLSANADRPASHECGADGRRHRRRDSR